MPDPSHAQAHLPHTSAARQHALHRRILRITFALALSLAPLPRVRAQHPAVGVSAAQPAGPHAPEPSVLSAKQWATDAANHELEMIHYKRPLLRYREHLIDSKGNQVRDVIESQDGAVARLIYRDGHVVTPEQDAAERQRLEDMINSPGAFAKHMKGDQTGKKIASDLLQQFPKAMIYTFVPGQPQRARQNLHPDEPAEIVIDFAPDPKWNPPGLAAEGLTGLRGRLWIDPRSHCITRMEGEIFQQVNFGWGLFAHVYPGGKLMLEQVNVENQRWIFSHFTENLVVRAVMVKTVRENSDIEASQFSLINPMTYQDAIRILLNTPLPKN